MEQEPELDPLLRQINILQQDWDAYKQQPSTTARHRRTRSFAGRPSTATASRHRDILALFDGSPKKLMSSLQQQQQQQGSTSLTSSPSDAWGRRDEAGEIALERRAAIRSGRLKGRSLLDALEGAAATSVEDEREEMCSVCSSVLIQGSSCSSFTSSSSGREDGNRRLPSSSWTSFSMEGAEGKVACAIRVGGGGIGKESGKKRMMMMMIGMAVFAAAPIVAGLCIMSLMGIARVEDGEHLIPT